MKNLYKFKTTLVLILLVMAGGMVMGQTPTVSTDNIYNISTDRARVAYTAAPNGATITEKGVCYSNTVNPPTTSNSKVTDGSLNDTSSVILSSLTPSQTYYVRAYAIYNGGVSTQYGDVIAFYTGTTFSVTYNCDIKNDVLNTSSEYQFDVWIYRTGDNALNLNNYQLGMEMSRLDLLGNEFMTGEYVAGTCQLGAGFEPSGMTIAKQLAGGGHAYDHMDVRINGLVPSSNSVLVGTSPGLRIGTFKLKNWTNGSYNVAKSFGAVQPDLGWDNDFIARTYIYAMISGVRTIITNINNHVAETVNPMFFSANWRGTTNTDWATAGNWLSSPTTGGPTVPPTSSDNVFIAGIDIVNYPVVSTRTTPACNALNIASGGNVTVGYNGDLTVNGTLTLGTTSGGPIRVNSESGGTGSLITLSTITGTGVATAKVQRYLSANAWHLISAPISDAKANVFTDQYLRPYDEVNNVWGSYVVDINTALTAATGFACWPVTSQAYTYTGTLNTGSISASGLTYSGGTRGNNCVGNPYPSAIDWNAVSGWTKTNVGGSIWIWNQTDNAYGVWNGSTGTHSVNQYIPVGQGFFIQATGSPTLSMTNAVRVHNTQGFLKNSDIPNSLRLKVKNSFGTDEIVVYFDQNSSWIYDPMIDSRKMFGTKTAPQLYSLKPSDPEELSINVLPEIKNPTVVPVCLEIGLNDQYEITASQIESFPSNVSIILEDKKLDKIQDLRINPIYSFAADTNDVADRFNLHFSNYPYGINDQNRDGIQVYSFGKNIYVKAETTITGDARITVSDALGRNLYESTFGISSLTKFDPNLGQGYYIVRVSTPSGVVTEKLFIQ